MRDLLMPEHGHGTPRLAVHINYGAIIAHRIHVILKMELCRAMGESNAARQREPQLSKKVWEAADQKYRDMFGGPDGVSATFQVSPHCD